MNTDDGSSSSSTSIPIPITNAPDSDAVPLRFSMDPDFRLDLRRQAKQKKFWLIALILSIVAQVLAIVAVSTDAVFSCSNSVVTQTNAINETLDFQFHFGYFRSCMDSKLNDVVIIQTCDSTDEIAEQSTLSAWLQTAEAFAVLSVLSLTTIGLLLLALPKLQQRRVTVYFLLALYGFNCVCNIISLITITTKISKTGLAEAVLDQDDIVVDCTPKLDYGGALQVLIIISDLIFAGIASMVLYKGKIGRANSGSTCC